MGPDAGTLTIFNFPAGLILAEVPKVAWRAQVRWADKAIFFIDVPTGFDSN